MAGVPLTQKLPPEQYTQSASMQVYQRVLMRAEAALQAGQSVIIDAVFAKENERAMAEAVARRAGAAFQGVWLEADADTLKARVTSRKADASDANAEVVEIQTGYDVGRIGWTRISAAGSIAETESAVRRSLPYPPAVRA